MHHLEWVIGLGLGAALFVTMRFATVLHTEETVWTGAAIATVVMAVVLALV